MQGVYLTWTELATARMPYFKRVYALAYYNASVTSTSRVLADIDECLWRAFWAVPPLVSVNPTTCSIEMLLLSKTAKTLVQWERLLRQRVCGVHVQCCMSLQRRGCDCIRRLIYTRARGSGSDMARFMDAYRVLSGGLMHPLDDRDWKMSRPATRRMKRQLAAVDEAMNRHYVEYCERLRLLDDQRVNVEEDPCALQLLEASLECGRNVGGLYDVLKRQGCSL